MRKGKALAVAVGVFMMLSVAAPMAAAQGLSIPVTGSGGGSTFAGTFTPKTFANSGGVVYLTGVVNGVLTNADGSTSPIIGAVTSVVSITQASCSILHLELGPLFLDLLGLQISLNQVVLDITAQPGPGNLLGNLLCAIAGLLDNPNTLTRVLNGVLVVLR